MRTAKAQISLRVRTVWSGRSLTAYMYCILLWMTRMIVCACAGWFECAFCACSDQYCISVDVEMCSPSRIKMTVSGAADGGIIYIKGYGSACRQETFSEETQHEFIFESCGINAASTFITPHVTFQCKMSIDHQSITFINTKPTIYSSWNSFVYLDCLLLNWRAPELCQRNHVLLTSPAVQLFWLYHSSWHHPFKPNAKALGNNFDNATVSDVNFHGNDVDMLTSRA